MKPILLRLLALVPLLLAGAALAQQPVGRVLLAAGDTFAVRNGQPVRLQYNSPIEFKDTLRTGAASSLQVRFNDESLLSLRENTDFAIEDYQFAAGDESRERAFFRLIKGGFRSVTGLIGRARNANYRVHTQTATIGIRGTDYAARMCAGDCGANVKDGLYGSVLGLSSGTNQITIENEGTPTPRTFGINQHFYVADVKTAPQPLLQPPTFVSIRPQGKAQAAQQGGSGTGGEQSASSSGAQAESRPSSVAQAPVVTPLLPFREVETLSAGGTPTALATLPSANGFVVLYPIGSGLEVIFDDDDLPATFQSGNLLSGYRHVSGVPAGSIGGGSITDTGILTLPNGQVLTYGRWTGPTAITTTSGLAMTNVPALFGTVSGLQDIDIKTIGGQATYSFIGGPSPVDAGGNVGTVTSSVLTANFTQASVGYSLGMMFPSIGSFGPATFSLSGSGSFGTGIHSGDYHGGMSGSCSGGGCASSSVSGEFTAGFTGTGGFGTGIVGGGVFNATQAGSVIFLNAHNQTSYTPGPPPASLTGQIAWANASPSMANMFTLGSSIGTVFSGTNPVSFACCGGFSGSFASATLSEPGATTLVDGGTMNWGRWTGANAQVVSPPNASLSPGTGVPFVVGPAGVTLPASGSFTYTFAGGPAPTNTAGQSGSWGGGAFLISYGTTQSISIATPLTMTVGLDNFTINSCGSGCVTSPTTVLGNMAMSGTCSGSNCSTSNPVTVSASGAIVGANAGGFAVTGHIMGPAPTVTFGGAFKQ